MRLLFLPLRLFLFIIITMMFCTILHAKIDHQVFAENIGNIDIDVAVITQKNKTVEKKVRAHDKEWIHLGDDCTQQIILSYTTQEHGSHQTVWIPPTTDCTNNLVIGVTSAKNKPEVLQFSTKDAKSLGNDIFENLTRTDRQVFVDAIFCDESVQIIINTKQGKTIKREISAHTLEWITLANDDLVSISFESWTPNNYGKAIKEFFPPFSGYSYNFQIVYDRTKNNPSKIAIAKFGISNEQNQIAPTYLSVLNSPIEKATTKSYKFCARYERSYSRSFNIAGRECQNFIQLSKNNKPVFLNQVIEDLKSLGYEFKYCELPFEGE